MAYDVSKKMNVGHGKILASVINNLFLKKNDAEKTYLSLSGGKMSGDITLDKSNVMFTDSSNTAKIGIDANQNLEIYNDKNIKFGTTDVTYFTANPSYLSLDNKHNNIAVEIVNEEGSGSPYGGLTVYDTKSGTPEIISAINSGIADDVPYQWFSIPENGNFVWSLIGDTDVNQIAKIDYNGLTLINKDDATNELAELRFQSTDGNVAQIKSILGDMRFNASEIMFNSVASIGNDSLDLIGGSALEFDSANDGVKMYSQENSDALTIDFKGKKLTIDENGFNGKASSADKLAAERTISGGTDILLNCKYDGSADSTAEIGFYACNAKVGNKNNYPYHRFAKIDLINENYTDWTTTLYISQGYNHGGFGLCRISMRTNGSSIASEAEIKWLFRDGLPADFIQIGIDSTSNATHADAFVKIGAAYASTTIRAVASEGRGVIKRTWTLVNSEEVNNTDASAKNGSVECYKSIDDAATELHNEAYTTIVTSPTKTEAYIVGIEAAPDVSIKVTYSNGQTETIAMII